MSNNITKYSPDDYGKSYPRRPRPKNRRPRGRSLQILFLSSIIALVLLLLGPSLVAPLLKDSLESWLKTQFQSQAHIGRLSISWFRISATDVRFRNPKKQIDLTFPQIRWRFDGIKFFQNRQPISLIARLDIHEPTITLSLTKQNLVQSASTTQDIGSLLQQTVSEIPIWVRPWLTGVNSKQKSFIKTSLHIEVDKAESTIHVLEPENDEESIRTIRWTNLTIRIQSDPSTNIYRIAATSKTNINGWGLRLQLPFKISGQLFPINNEWVAKETYLQVAGLDLIGRGTSNFNTSNHHWTFRTHVPDLSQVKVLPAFLPPGLWQGGLTSKLNIVKQPKRNLQISGQLSATQLTGKIDWVDQDITARGIVNGRAFVDFYFEDRFLFRESWVELDLTRTSISYKNLFSKVATTPLKIVAKGDRQKDSLRLKDFRLNFANFSGRAKGIINYRRGGASKIAINIPRSTIDGWEKYFPFMAGVPTRGALQLRALFSGDWQDLSNASISINPITISNLRVKLDWRDPARDIFVLGPLSADIQGEIITQGLKVIRGDIDGRINASHLSWRWKNLINKSPSNSLSLQLTAKQSDRLLKIQRARLFTDAGSAKIWGEIRDLNQFVLYAKTDSFNLGLLSNWFRPALPLSSVDKLQGDLQLTGQYYWNLGQWGRLPRLEGVVMAHSQLLSLPPPLEASGTDYALPPVLQSLWDANLSGQFTADKVESGSWTANNLQLKGDWKKHEFSGEASLSNFFSGTIKVNSLEVSTQPTAVKSQLKFKQLAIEPLIANLLPEMPPPISGPVDGEIKISFPWNNRILKELRFSGSLNSPKASVAIPFDQYLGKAQTVQALPLRHLPSFNREGDFNMSFIFNEQTFQINKSIFSFAGKDRWQAKGQVSDTISVAGKLNITDANKKAETLVNWNWSGPRETPLLSIDLKELERFLPVEKPTAVIPAKTSFSPESIYATDIEKSLPTKEEIEEEIFKRRSFSSSGPEVKPGSGSGDRNPPTRTGKAPASNSVGPKEKKKQTKPLPASEATEDTF